MEKKSSKKKDDLRAGRVVLNLNREEFEFIDKLGRDALFSTGKRLTNNKIITTIINAIKEININGIGLHSCEELKNRFFVALGLRKDKRKYPRFRKEVKVLWRKLDSMAEYKLDQTTDISEEGFRIIIPTSLIPAKAGIHKPGDVLEFTIIEPSMQDEPMKALGRIAWVKTHRETNSIEAGIKLTFIPEKDKDRFNNLLCKELTTEGVIKNG